MGLVLTWLKPLLVMKQKQALHSDCRIVVSLHALVCVGCCLVIACCVWVLVSEWCLINWIAWRKYSNWFSSFSFELIINLLTVLAWSQMFLAVFEASCVCKALNHFTGAVFQDKPFQLYLRQVVYARLWIISQGNTLKINFFGCIWGKLCMQGFSMMLTLGWR